MDRTATFHVGAEQAALYRLTGDRHFIHIDPVAAEAAGFDRPILHGLCTLGIAAREISGVVGAAPWELRTIGARFAAPLSPGSDLMIAASEAAGDGSVSFEASVGESRVLSAGYAGF
jgi:acyl dehydratase